MKQMTENNYVLIGLPQSGKSTFIAALWYVIESKELENSLIIEGMPEEREYLNNLRDTWLSFKDFERTKVDNKHQITLRVTNESNSNISVLKFPDVSGEMYKIQFENRKLDLKYLELIQSANGIILFINPDHMLAPQLISNIDLCIGSEPLQIGMDKAKKWEHKDTPTQVILIDILQMILFNINQSLKVAVIVSAWDVINNKIKISPSKWVEDNLPLLFQYLNANNSLIKFTFWGLSAQGGNYSECKNELELKTPSERIMVQTEAERSNDITLPIKWLLNNE